MEVGFRPLLYFRTPENERWKHYHRAEELLKTHHEEDGLHRLEHLHSRVIHHIDLDTWPNRIANAALLAGTAAGTYLGAHMGGLIGGGIGLVVGVIGTGGAVLGVTNVLDNLRLWSAVKRVERTYGDRPAPGPVDPPLAPDKRPEAPRLDRETVRQNVPRYFSAEDLTDAGLRATVKGDEGALQRLERATSTRMLLEQGVREGAEVHTWFEYPNSGGDAADPVYDPERLILYTSVGDRERSRLVALNPNGELLWSSDDRLKSGVCIGPDGKVYFNTEHQLNCYTPEGSRLWSVSMNDSSFNRTTPAVGTDGTVYVARRSEHLGTQEYNVSLVAYREGKEIWRQDVDGDYTQPPEILVAKDGTVCLAGAENRAREGWFAGEKKDAFLGFDPADGKRRFRAEVPYWTGYVRSSLSQGPDGTLYACHSERNLTAFSPSGKPRWTYQLKGRVRCEHGNVRLRQSPSFDRDGNLLISTGSTSAYPEGYVIKLDARSGKELWRVSVQGDLASRPEAGPDGKIRVTSSAGDLLTLSSDGQVLDQTRVGGSAWNNLTHGHDGAVYVNTDKKILAFQPDLDKMTAAPSRSGEGLTQPATIADQGASVVVGGVRLRKARGFKPADSTTSP